MYHLKTQTITELTTSKVSNTCICQYTPFVGIGSKLQMGEGNNNQKVFNFSKSKLKGVIKYCKPFEQILT